MKAPQYRSIKSKGSFKASIVAFLFTLVTATAQVGINTTTPEATLDIQASSATTPANNDGILIPRVDNFPATLPTLAQDAMLVFATGNGTPTRGFYYWDHTNTIWTPLGNTTVTGGNTLDQAYEQGGAGLGKNINATDGAVRINGTDGFLVTGTQLSGDVIDDEVTGVGTRMFFNPNKAAFRAGIVQDLTPFLPSDQWDDANIGLYSTAMGSNTVASGGTSTAFGSFTTASGNISTAFGSVTTASGHQSTAFGYNSVASGAHAIAMGYEVNATETGAIAMGNFTNASGFYATAFGHTSTASGLRSVAYGTNTTASGEASTAFGASTIASGLFATSFGFANSAMNNRATAFGVANLASGDASTVYGSTNTASGNISTAYGHMNTASGDISTAFGHQNTASGSYATVFGRLNNATGSSSIAYGTGTEASSFSEIAIGTYNTILTPVNANGFNSADRLFVVGYGSNASFRRDALSVFKSGRIWLHNTTGIATGSPTATLSVNGTANKPGGGSWAVFSDRRLKKEVTTYGEGLDLILQVQPVSYTYNDTYQQLLGYNSSVANQRYQGVIAQELQEIAPDMVNEVVVNDQSFLEVDPNKFTYALINAVKQQQELIITLYDQVSQLQAAFEQQQQELDALKKLVQNQ